MSFTTISEYPRILLTASDVPFKDLRMADAVITIIPDASTVVFTKLRSEHLVGMAEELLGVKFQSPEIMAGARCMFKVDQTTMAMLILHL